ncbi:MAG TPA: hypothetical protein VFQ15_01995, partial [Jiangellaceae bacterium]|nr:hypothetical protein [Jiangellaceae bacterium]
AIEGAKDDRTVAEKLLAREENAHRSLGSVEAAIGVYDAKAEEDRLVRDLLNGKTVDESYEQSFEADVLGDLMGEFSDTATATEVQLARVPKLFTSTSEFAEAALRELYDDRPEDAIDLHREEELITFLAPDDLIYRLSDLPKSYLQAHREGDRLRLKVTFDRKLAQRKLDQARQAKTTSWPEIAFLSDVHPMIDWLIDKVLIRLGRQQAPVLTADVDQPTFLIQGVYANKLGQPTIVKWMAVSGATVVEPMDQVLAAAGVGPKMVNRAEYVDLETLQKLVPAAVAVAREHLAEKRAEWEAETAEPLQEYREKLTAFAGEQASLFDGLPAAIKSQRARHTTTTVKEQNDLVDRLETIPDPLLRVLAVLVKPGEGIA